MANPNHLAKLKEGVDQWNVWRKENYPITPDLSIADLTGAEIIMATIGASDPSQSDLMVANVIATVHKTSLSGANLNEANLSKARMKGTVLGNVDLSTVRGLESVRHDGPSTIGIDTLYSSEGKIPEVFLRGCGVPEPSITYAHSLIT